MSRGRPILLVSAIATAASAFFLVKDETVAPSSRHVDSQTGSSAKASSPSGSNSEEISSAPPGGPATTATVSLSSPSQNMSAQKVGKAPMQGPISGFRRFPHPAFGASSERGNTASTQLELGPEVSTFAKLSEHPGKVEPVRFAVKNELPPTGFASVQPRQDDAETEHMLNSEEHALEPADYARMNNAVMEEAGTGDSQTQAAATSNYAGQLNDVELEALEAVKLAASTNPPHDPAASPAEACVDNSERDALDSSPANCAEHVAVILPTGEMPQSADGTSSLAPISAAADRSGSNDEACSPIFDQRDCPGSSASGVASRSASAAPPNLPDGVTAYTIGVTVGGRAAQPVPILIDRKDNILIGVSGLLSTVRDLMDPAAYSRLAASSAASSYVNLEKLRTLGFTITFDDRRNTLILTAR